MFLHKILLKDFRLFPQKIVEFDKQVSVIVAPNAKGKSTLLEAIYLLASGQSFRAEKIEEMIGFGKEISQVKGKIFSDELSLRSKEDMAGLDELQLSVLLTRGLVNGRKTQRLHFSVNDNKRRKKEFVGNLLAVLFGPEDMRLIEGSPSRRRQFFDGILLQLDRDYQTAHKQYEQTLRRRNKLLSQIRDGEQSKSVLTYWNMSLIKHGESIQSKRRELLEFINATVSSPLFFQIKYLPSLISELRLNQYAQSEMAAGFTLIGPHKDDFEVLIDISKSAQENIPSSQDERNKTISNIVSLNAYGSRGQKRMGVLWLKKAELVFIKHTSSKLPVLLLDDILSELDKKNRLRVLQMVDGEQIIITTTDKKMVEEVVKVFKKIQVVELN